MGKFLTDEQMSALEAEEQEGKFISDEQMAQMEADEANQPGMLEAGARGFTEGATAGFGDEISGAMGAAGDLLLGNTDLENIGDSYREYRDAFRKDNTRAKEANPYTYGASGIVGAAVGPGKLVKGAKSATALGGLTGLGLSEADNLQDAAIDTATGAGLALAGQQIGEKVIAPVMKGAGDRTAKVFDYLSKKFGRRAERMAEKATGATAAQAEKFGEGSGRQLLDRGLVKAFNSPDDVAVKAAKLLRESGEEIGVSLEQLEAGGAAKIPKADIINKLSERLQAFKADPSKAGVARKLERLIADFSDDAVPDELGLTAAENIKRGYQNQANYNKPLTTQAQKEAASTVRKTVEDTALASDPALAQKFTDAKQTYGLIAPIKEAASRRGMQLKQSPIGGLLDTTTAIGGAMSGEPVTAVAATVGRRLLAPRAASTAAVGLDTISKALQSAPQTFGKFAPQLQQAAQRGQAALAATHFLLSQQEQDYRSMVEENFGQTR